MAVSILCAKLQLKCSALETIIRQCAAQRCPPPGAQQEAPTKQDVALVQALRAENEALKNAVTSGDRLAASLADAQKAHLICTSNVSAERLEALLTTRCVVKVSLTLCSPLAIMSLQRGRVLLLFLSLVIT